MGIKWILIKSHWLKIHIEIIHFANNNKLKCIDIGLGNNKDPKIIHPHTHKHIRYEW